MPDLRGTACCPRSPVRAQVLSLAQGRPKMASHATRRLVFCRCQRSRLVDECHGCTKQIAIPATAKSRISRGPCVVSSARSAKSGNGCLILDWPEFGFMPAPAAMFRSNSMADARTSQQDCTKLPRMPDAPWHCRRSIMVAAIWIYRKFERLWRQCGPCEWRLRATNRSRSGHQLIGSHLPRHRRETRHICCR
jgi:hypothetical protein